MYSKTRVFVSGWAVVMLVLLSLPVNGAPNLLVSQKIASFGVVSPGTIVKYSFLLHNNGDSELKVNRVLALCNCITTERSQSNIHPGGEATLQVKIDTTGYSGEVTFGISVKTNDRASDWIELKLSGVVREPRGREILSSKLKETYQVLVDIRSYKRFNQQHLIGAVNIPESQLPGRLTTLPQDLSIFVYNQTGKNYDVVRKQLGDHFNNIKFIFGGLLGWKRRYGNSLLVAEKSVQEEEQPE